MSAENSLGQQIEYLNFSMDTHPGDVAAVWDIKLADGAHKIVFEHGTTSGKRVIIVDGEEVLIVTLQQITNFMHGQ